MARMATTDEFEDYLENGLCPYCYAEDVVEDETNIEGDTMRLSKFCTKCDMKWTEIHTKDKNGQWVMTGLYLDDTD